MKSEMKIVESLDLNLLRVLTAMNQAKNVTQAAELLGMSQSGFSTALMRLRRHFSDELFIRSGGTMQPTSRALQMLGPAADVLTTIQEHILNKPVFDPLTTSTEFKIAMADVAELIYLPTLLQHFSRLAPHANITTQLPSGDSLRTAMALGEVDLAVGYFPDLTTQQFFKQRLYTHTFACIARKGHPMGNKLTVRAYEQYGHAVTAVPTRSTVLLDKFLKSKGVHRRISLRTPHHLVLPVVVSQTDLIATVPQAVADHLASHPDIQVLSLPFASPKFLVQQHWHRSVHKDARNEWLRQQFMTLFGTGQTAMRALEGDVSRAGTSKALQGVGGLG